MKIADTHSINGLIEPLEGNPFQDLTPQSGQRFPFWADQINGLETYTTWAEMKGVALASNYLNGPLMMKSPLMREGPAPSFKSTTVMAKG